MINLRFNNYDRQCKVSKDISSTWEDVRGLTGYYDNKTSNIHKKDGDTWYFTFFLKKGKYKAITATSITGKAYSKDNSLTVIEIKVSSYYSTITLVFLFIFLNVLAFYFGDSNLATTVKVIFMILLAWLFIHAHNKEARRHMNELINELKLEE